MTDFLENVLDWLICVAMPIALACGWMLMALIGVALFFVKRRKAAAWVGGIALLWLTILLSVDFMLVGDFASVKNNFHLVKPGMTEAEVHGLLGEPDTHYTGRSLHLLVKSPYYNRHVYSPSRAFGHPTGEPPFWAVHQFELSIFGPNSTDYVVYFDPNSMKVVSTKTGDP